MLTKPITDFIKAALIQNKTDIAFSDDPEMARQFWGMMALFALFYKEPDGKELLEPLFRPRSFFVSLFQDCGLDDETMDNFLAHEETRKRVSVDGEFEYNLFDTFQLIQKTAKEAI